MQKLRAARALVAAALFTFSTFPFRAAAQATDGNLTGVVFDGSGAAVTGARIAAGNTLTGISYSAKSGAEGSYRIPNIPAGSYSIRASAIGFSTFRLDDVRVELNGTATANFILQPEGTTNSITVTSAPAPVDAATAQIQSGYTARQITGLPVTALNQGVNNLALLSAGVASSGGLGVGEGPSVGGQRPRNNSFNIEGIDNNRKDASGSLTSLSNEAVGEFMLLRNHFSAEFGHAGGGQFNSILRSGGSDLHGTLFEYLQNRHLNAIDQSVKRQGVRSNPRHDDNRFGGNIGGPVIANKLFYFGQLEFRRRGFVANPTAAVLSPTADGYKMLAGLPGVSKTNLGVLQRYLAPSPAATRVTSVNGTDIPIGIVPIAFPAFQNLRNSVASVDYHFSARDQLRGRFVETSAPGVDVFSLPGLPGFLNTRNTSTKLLILTENHVFSPSITNEFRAGYNRYNDAIPAGDYDFPGLDAFPNIRIQNDLNASLGAFVSAPQSTILNTYQIVDNLNWIRGAHSVKAGFDGRRYIASTNFIQAQRGSYAYTTLGRFLQDLPPDVLAERSLGGTAYSGNSHNYYGFINDDWRVRRNVSLNLGVRYEYKGVPAGDQQQALNASSSRPGLLQFRAPQAQTKNFAPRVDSHGRRGATRVRPFAPASAWPLTTTSTTSAPTHGRRSCSRGLPIHSAE